MVNVVIIAHLEIAHSFALCVEHILAKRVNNLHVLAVRKSENMEHVLHQAQELVRKASHHNHQVLILCDLFGATPYNIAQHLVHKNHVELITGLNLPMLIRAVTHANSDLATVVNKVLDGASSGIVHIDGVTNNA